MIDFDTLRLCDHEAVRRLAHSLGVPEHGNHRSLCLAVARAIEAQRAHDKQSAQSSYTVRDRRASAE